MYRWLPLLIVLLCRDVIAGGINNPSGAGGGSGTVTTVSCTTANGVSCTVANPTTTPALTFTLGAITPSSVNGITISDSNTPTWTIGSASGVPVVTASSPLVITSATGNITCATCNTSNATVSSVTFTGDGTVLSSTPSSSVTTSGTLTASLAAQTQNTVLGAATSTTLVGLAMPSCSAATSALEWTTNTGFGCHAITSGVSSVSGDGVLVSNSSSTGAVTLTLANAAANTVWGNNTGSSAAPGYQTAINVSGNITGAAGSFTTGAFSSTITGTSTSANALAIGTAGATNPVFNVDASTASAVAGVDIVGAATGGTVLMQAIDSGSNTGLDIEGKGSGVLTLAKTSTGGVNIGTTSSTGAVAIRENVSSNGFSVLHGNAMIITETTSGAAITMTPLSTATASTVKFTVSPTFSNNLTAGGNVVVGSLGVSGKTMTNTSGAKALQTDWQIYGAADAFSAASTLTTGATLQVTPKTCGANGTCTNEAAIYVPATAITATNGYGLYVSAPTGASTINAAAYLGGAVGIGTANPMSELDVYGGVAIGTSYAGATAAPTNGMIVQGAVSIGTSSNASFVDINPGTTISQSYWGTNGIGLNARAATFNDNSSSGTVATANGVYTLNTPTITSTNATTYSGVYATLYVFAPVAGSNATLSQRYSIYTDNSIGTASGVFAVGTVQGNPIAVAGSNVPVNGFNRVTTNTIGIYTNSLLTGEFLPTASSVDYLTFAGAATANPANTTISVAGTDTNIGINLTTKGTGVITANNLIVRKGYTVATLPASPPTGAMAYVTDAVACTFLATLTGGGAAYCPVGYNGSAWIGE